MIDERSIRRLYRPVSDLLGAVASGVCALHCALMPVAAAFLPAALSRVLSGSLVHGVFAVLVAGTSLVAFVPGWLRHGESRIWPWAMGGMGLIGYARMAEPAALGVAGEAICTTLGGLLLLVAHRLNHSLAYWAGRL
jgi:hypothetical protein